MNKLKENLKKTSKLYLVVAIFTFVLYCILQVLSVSKLLVPLILDANSILVGAFAVSIAKIIRSKRILNNPSRLQEEAKHIADERACYIEMKATLLAYKLLGILLLFAGIIASYINVYVYYTILIIVFLWILLSVVIRIIFSKKY